MLAVPAGAGEAEPSANVVFVVRKAGGAPTAADALAARCDRLQQTLGGDRLGIDVAHELGFDLARERSGVYRRTTARGPAPRCEGRWSVVAGGGG